MNVPSNFDILSTLSLTAVGGDSYAEPVSDSYLVGVNFPGARPGRRFKRIPVFSRRHRRYICLQLSACLVLAEPTATLSLAFKLLPGRLPAGTPKFEFQRTGRIIPYVNRGRSAHDAKFISIRAGAMDGIL